MMASPQLQNAAVILCHFLSALCLRPALLDSIALHRTYPSFSHPRLLLSVMLQVRDLGSRLAITKRTLVRTKGQLSFLRSKARSLQQGTISPLNPARSEGEASVCHEEGRGAGGGHATCFDGA